MGFKIEMVEKLNILNRCLFEYIPLLIAIPYVADCAAGHVFIIFTCNVCG